MTLAAVWIETTPGGNGPLCFASDSRTTPGPIDGVTKVSLFGREDLVGVWAGDYRYAMLIMSHLDAVLTASDAMRRRDIDVRGAFGQAREAVKAHLERAMDPPVPLRQRVVGVQRPEPVVVLVGGFSIREQAYYLLRVEWLARKRSRWKCSVVRIEPGDVIFIGDELPLARARARKARTQRLPDHEDDWRMEPLSSIHFACVDTTERSRSVGGALQLAKTYRHGSARAYAISEPAAGEDVTYRGAIINQRARRELEGAGLLVSLESWDTQACHFVRGSS